MKKTSALILAETGESREDQILFQPAISYTIRSCKKAGIQRIGILKAGSCELSPDFLEEDIALFSEEDRFFRAAEFLNEAEESVLLLNDKHPLSNPADFKDARLFHQKMKQDATVIAVHINDPHGYDRVIRRGANTVRIAKENTVSETERLICDVDSGACWCQKKSLLSALQHNAAAASAFLKTLIGSSNIFVTKNANMALSVDHATDLLAINQIVNEQNISALLCQDVRFLSRDGILIGNDVRVGAKSCILPGTILRGKTVIGQNCVIGPNSLLEDTTVKDNVVLNATQAYQSVVEDGATIGPFCHIRPNSHIKGGVHIGDFVEVKNSTVGENTHISHLTYVGDSDVGQKVNFGCGVVTVNYNGKSKNRCVIGNNAFIGCNTNLVAPVTVGDNGYTAAGSTITDNVPADSLAIARARQVNKEGYNKKLRGE